MADALRILAFGAHPDDCDLMVGGLAIKYARLGHGVKLVAMCNGNAGHHVMGGGPLAQRRYAEAQRSAVIASAGASGRVEYVVLDIPDCQLMPTLENRWTVVSMIREFQADLVITNRPNDYHPDHRYTGILVQDAAYMVTVPFFCPDVPALKKNPVFAYFPDGFQKPTAFAPDVAVAIDSVIEKKLDAVLCMESQFIEGGCGGGLSRLASDPAQGAKQREGARQGWAGRDKGHANRFRRTLIEFYGEERGAKVQYAEAFEICEYGRRPSKEELNKLFPFFD